MLYLRLALLLALAVLPLWMVAHLATYSFWTELAGFAAECFLSLVWMAQMAIAAGRQS